MTDYPITLEEFKLFFLREAGLDYQPYPTWVKTVFDKGDWCLFEGNFYKSLVDLNIEEPLTGDNWEQATETWLEGNEYNEGEIVSFNGKYYKARETTKMAPGTQYWSLVDSSKEFPNSRVWAVPTVYNTGDKVLAIVNFKPGVWESFIDNNYTSPAKETFIDDSDEAMWQLNEDDTVDLQDVILDADIMRAMGEAIFKFNKRLFSEERGKMIFLYLTMFFLVYDRQMASAGMNGNSAAGPVIHRSVGKMSVTYAESKMYEKYPSYEFLATNDYGRKAFNLLRPYLTGGISIFRGGSTGE